MFDPGRVLGRGLRFRGTHQSHVGPICPVCRTPLSNHFTFQTKKRAIVRQGQTGRECFEVLVC